MTIDPSELADALEDLLDGMGVVLDDPRLNYLTVQVDRVDVEAARDALAKARE
jgi:hypothetical protein